MTTAAAQANAPDHVAQLAAAPVFVVGCPRSGTTWVQRLLLAHPQVCGGQESHFFTSFAPLLKMVEVRGSERRDVGLRCYWTKDSFTDEIRRLWQLTMKPIIEAAPAATLLIEKTPEHATCMDRIVEVLPAARFIHVIRDSRAVAASMFAARNHAWGRWAPRNVFKASRKWLDCVNRAQASGAALGASKYMEVRYEDLHTDGVSHTRRMLDFAGLPVEPGQVEEIVRSQQFNEQAKSGGTPIKVVGEAAGVADSARPEPTGFFNRGKADSWRSDLTIIQKASMYLLTRSTMHRVGYSW